MGHNHLRIQREPSRRHSNGELLGRFVRCGFRDVESRARRSHPPSRPSLLVVDPLLACSCPRRRPPTPLRSRSDRLPDGRASDVYARNTARAASSFGCRLASESAGRAHRRVIAGFRPEVSRGSCRRARHRVLRCGGAFLCRHRRRLRSSRISRGEAGRPRRGAVGEFSVHRYRVPGRTGPAAATRRLGDGGRQGSHLGRDASDSRTPRRRDPDCVCHRDTRRCRNHTSSSARCARRVRVRNSSPVSRSTPVGLRRARRTRPARPTRPDAPPCTIPPPPPLVCRPVAAHRLRQDRAG
ncbi:hypothetical protein MMM2322_01478 [Microbacterium sp. MM2322]